MRPPAFVPWLSLSSSSLSLQRPSPSSSLSVARSAASRTPLSTGAALPRRRAFLRSLLVADPSLAAASVCNDSYFRNKFDMSGYEYAPKRLGVPADGPPAAAAVGTPASDATPVATEPRGVSELFAGGKRPNILFIITDQERSVMHWPEDFVAKHLPSLHRLQQNGLTFQQGFCNACMCSPSRASLLTGQFPVVTGVTSTGSPEPKFALPTPDEEGGLQNIASYLTRNYGYHCEWHGKWHLGNDPADYGFRGWQPPDAGNYLSLNDTLGGGSPDNDGRFLDEIKDFLRTYVRKSESEDVENTVSADGTAQGTKDIDNSKPFCLVASFVNPHDVYVAQYDPTLGYTQADFRKVHVPLPENYKEDLFQNYKPRCQGDMGWPFVTFDNEPQDYVNFYAYLHTIVDRQIGQVLDTLDQCGLTDSTLIIRTADHGEQALSHTLVEKFYNAYEESIRVPFIVSNPVAFPSPFRTDALASHVDLLPTLLSLLEESCSQSNSDHAAVQGIAPVPLKDTDCVGSSLGSLWKNPEAATKITRTRTKHKDLAVQGSIHFTYDDIPNYRAPSTVRCLRTMRYKYAVYFTPSGKDADWELYDLQKDPLENNNLAGRPEFETLQNMLDRQLVHHMTHKQTMPTRFEWPPEGSPKSIGRIGSGGSTAAEAAKKAAKQPVADTPNGYPELPIDEIMEYKRMMEERRLMARLARENRRRGSNGSSSSSSSSGGPVSMEDSPPSPPATVVDENGDTVVPTEDDAVNEDGTDHEKM